MKNEVKFKQVGQNLNLTLPTEKEVFSARIEDKDSRDDMKAQINDLIEQFNKTKSDRTRKTITNKLKTLYTSFNKDTKVEQSIKAKATSKAKAVKKAKADINEAKGKSKETLKKVASKTKSASKQSSSTQGRRYSGEH